MSQLEAAWAQKEKFIQSNRMIMKFRDDYIAQLKKELQTGQRSDPEQQNQELQEEIRLLRDQVDPLKFTKVDRLHNSGVWVNSDSVDQHVFDPTVKVEWKN